MPQIETWFACREREKVFTHAKFDPNNLPQESLFDKINLGRNRVCQVVERRLNKEFDADKKKIRLLKVKEEVLKGKGDNNPLKTHFSPGPLAIDLSGWITEEQLRDFVKGKRTSEFFEEIWRQRRETLLRTGRHVASNLSKEEECSRGLGLYISRIKMHYRRHDRLKLDGDKLQFNTA